MSWEMMWGPILLMDDFNVFIPFPERKYVSKVVFVHWYELVERVHEKFFR